MKRYEMGLSISVLALFFLTAGAGSSFGDEEIDLGGSTATAPATTAAPKPAPTVAPAPAAQSAPTPASQEIEMEDENETTTQAAPQPTPTVFEVHGMVKMKDIYDAGKAAYQEQDYERAIRYWNKAVGMKDPYTPKFYYAEAYAMLGVIYQYHVIHYGHAYRCYAAALKYEKNNSTARRHIKQVYKYRKRKD